MSRNKYAIGTVVGAALLGLAKSSLLGSKNDRVVVYSIEELRQHANDPKLAPLVTEVDLDGNQLTNLPSEIGNLTNLKTLYLNNNPNFKITIDFVLDLLNTYQNTDVAEVLSKYIHQQTIPARQAIRMR